MVCVALTTCLGARSCFIQQPTQRGNIVLSLLILLIPIGLIVLIVVLLRRRKNPARLNIVEIGTIIDRALRSYRRHFLPLLALSAICAPLGALAYTSALSAITYLNLLSTRDALLVGGAAPIGAAQQIQAILRIVTMIIVV